MINSSKDIKRLVEIMAALRTPGTGCPWDLAQDFSTIAPYTIEEAYEVADAIERDDMDDLRLELGDLLLQSVYHARLAEEAGHFDFGDVVEGITAKMIRRHPHVFGTEDVTAQEYSAEGMASGTWERIKSEEKAEAAKRRAELGLPEKTNGKSLLDDVPVALPGLSAALKLQKKAGKVGFDWANPDDVVLKIKEEIEELQQEIEVSDQEAIEGELGDLLFALANLARHLNIDPEKAIKRTNSKFRKRFAYIEQALDKSGKTLKNSSLNEMESLWQEAKGKASTDT